MQSGHFVRSVAISVHDWIEALDQVDKARSCSIRYTY